MTGAGRPYTPYNAAAEEGVDGGLSPGMTTKTHAKVLKLMPLGMSADDRSVPRGECRIGNHRCTQMAAMRTGDRRASAPVPPEPSVNCGLQPDPLRRIRRQEPVIGPAVWYQATRNRTQDQGRPRAVLPIGAGQTGQNRGVMPSCSSSPDAAGDIVQVEKLVHRQS